MLPGNLRTRPAPTLSLCSLLLTLLSPVAPKAVWAEDPPGHAKEIPSVAVPAKEALQRLVDGNRRFVADQPRHPHESHDWRDALEKGQHPFAVILGCSDSRVPIELLFDQGFGDLFVIRVAGNVVDTDVTASIEYAVYHLDTRLIVVLGHSHCGAVSAAVDHLTESPSEPEAIVSLLYRIEPALDGLPESMPRKSRVAEAVKRNVQRAVRRLSDEPDMRKACKTKDVQVVGGVYDLHTGEVAFLDSKASAGKPTVENR